MFRSLGLLQKTPCPALNSASGCTRNPCIFSHQPVKRQLVQAHEQVSAPVKRQRLTSKAVPTVPPSGVVKPVTREVTLEAIQHKPAIRSDASTSALPSQSAPRPAARAPTQPAAVTPKVSSPMLWPLLI